MSKLDTTVLLDIGDQIKRLESNFKKSVSRHTLSYCEARIDLLEQYWENYTEEYKQLLKASPSRDEFKLLKEAIGAVEDLYLDFKTELKQKIATLTLKEKVNDSSPAISQVRLPPINLPVFSGNYGEWTNFKDLFVSLIDNDQGLSAIQKHHYLRSSLKGEAEQLLRHFDVTAANYKQAWETLTNRYSNKRVIVNTIINRLLNLKKMNQECPKGLKELIDSVNECISSLKNIGINVQTWDPILVHLVVLKLDLESHKAWEQSLGSTTELPTFDALTTFLEGRFRAMEMIQTTLKKDKKETNTTQNTGNKIKTVKSFGILSTECTFCNQKSHYICHCTEFTKLDIEQRREFVKDNGLCFNCLVKGHSVRHCRQQTSCKACNHKHHTLLHDDKVVARPAITYHPETEETPVEEKPVELTSMNISSGNRQVVLATAQVAILDRNGSYIKLRALVDQGSQGTFITESAVQLLGLNKRHLEANVTGIGNNNVKSEHVVDFDMFSTLDSTHVARVSAHVLTKLTPLLPSRKLDISQWTGLTSLKLSDPHMHQPGPIDLLLGADVYATILLEGLKKYNTLIAQNSKLGWLVSGTIQAQSDLSSHTILVSTTLVEVDQLLRKFWETEEYLPHERPLTQLEAQCEDHYEKTHKRNDDGRYVVNLPFKDEHEQRLGDSRDISQIRLLHMERRFLRKPILQKEYTNFIDEYQTLNHMEDVNPLEPVAHKIYYLPHHAVLREASTTTKLRVVFDGSAKPANGSALNDELLVGPVLQQDLRDLIIRWRTHKVCLIADIRQMYRQILVAKEDVDYQRILWRPSPTDNIVEKRLLTVTYGTSCAPFLAIRTLKQLAKDERSNYPDLFDTINNDFYMDDLLTGANGVEEAMKLQKGITEVMSKGGFEMHKWASNSTTLLGSIPNDKRASKESVDIKMDDTIKALGVKWNSRFDVFELKLDISPEINTFTKTTVLSDIARAFDPLGFLSPIIVTAKIFLQKLWLSGINWTDELPPELACEWSIYRDQILNMSTLRLDRWLRTRSDGLDNVEVHGFSDASSLAYAAVVYVKVTTQNGIYVTPVIAKTKVAPVKQVSLPRLELCGALLLSKLIKDVKTSLKLDNDSVFAYTDSTIVLSWLRKNPRDWKTYVANRTTEILNILSSDRWHHVKSSENPADIATRGMSPDQLKDCDLWSHGPQFLQSPESTPSTYLEIPDTSLERREIKVQATVALKPEDGVLSHLNRFSKLQRLIRVTAFMFRFVKICKARIEAKRSQMELASFPQYLTVEELRLATNVCIRISQGFYFHEEIQILKKGHKLPKNSKLISLSPYLDKNGILRVSGRLRNAQISPDMKSPILLSAKCHLSQLIVEDAHNLALHSGPQLTLNIIRQRYWMIGARNLVRKSIRKCITCFKFSSAPINQLMGQLPACRVTPTKPFRISGVDYAGPITLKLYPGRCQRTTKAYICLFICTVTKAIHLELVSDLSTAAFLAAFRRFTSRRGHCSDLWSDCATNFVGASRELDLMFKNAKSEMVGEIAELLANVNTTWHFIPPGSPHFGGLWEAGVKSIKMHLKRVIGQTLLTFEEYSTLLAQVEACVNSRPLTPVSNSLDDIPPITPGHFLIGEAPINVPEGSLENVNASRLDRWQLIQKFTQDLWSRWSSEYLTTLQNRHKWSTQEKQPKIGMVVLVKDERLPPGKWLLGRIIDTHPGQDGLIRVVTLKYKNNVFKRPITKICPLPFEE